MGDKVFKLVGMGLAFGAAVAARQVATKGWKLVMNDDPPANPEDPDTQMWEAVLWALGSGAVIALARLVATREWTKYMKKSAPDAVDNPDELS